MADGARHIGTWSSRARRLDLHKREAANRETLSEALKHRGRLESSTARMIAWDGVDLNHDI